RRRTCGSLRLNVMWTRRRTRTSRSTRARSARDCFSPKNGRHAAVLTQDVGDLQNVSRAMLGEYLATHALALAAAGRRRRAEALAAEALSTTQAVETRVLAAAAVAVARAGTDSAKSAADGLMEVATTLQTWD